MRHFTHARAWALAVVGSLAAVSAAPVAWAQDYTKTDVATRQYVVPDDTWTELEQFTEWSIVRVPLPFDFPYFGQVFPDVWVGAHGYLQFSAADPTFVITFPPPGNTPYKYFPFYNQAFPFPDHLYFNGVIAAAWMPLVVNSTTVAGAPTPENTGASIWHKTVGSAGQRVFMVSWENAPTQGIWSVPSTTGRYYFQIHLHEADGKIVLAYAPSRGSWTAMDNPEWLAGLPWYEGWDSDGFTHGLDAPGQDTRYVSVNDDADNITVPTTDFQFVPDSVTYSGTVLIDEIVADASGIGNSTIPNRPAAGLRVELMNGDTVVGYALTDAQGVFELKGLALDETVVTGELRITSASSAGRVLDDDGDVYSVGLLTSVHFDAGQDLGPPVVIGTNFDSTGTIRAAMQSAMFAAEVRDWVNARLTSPVPPVDFTYDVDAVGASTFTKGYVEDIEVTILDPADPQRTATITYIVPTWRPAESRLASAGSGNDDGFDDAVLTRVWAHHVVATLAATPSQAPSVGLDEVSTIENAFVEGFGAWLYNQFTGVNPQIDGVDGSTATTFDITAPQLGATEAPDVGGWVAAALYDISDGSNESHDSIDGTGSAADAELPLTLVEAMSTEPTPTRFVTDWIAAGLDGTALVRNFIHHGLLPDDTWELNDTFDEAADVGVPGIRIPNLTLNQHNEDWFLVTAGAETTRLFCDVAFPEKDTQDSSAPTVTLEIRSLAGTELAVGNDGGQRTGALVAAYPPPADPQLPLGLGAFPLPAGDYLVRVVLDSGPPIPDYTLQIYAPLVITGPDRPEWTIGRRFDQEFEIRGGISDDSGNFQLSVTAPASLPAGMFLTTDPDPPGIAGTLATAGGTGDKSYPVTVTDAGDPTHTAVLTRRTFVNPALSFSAPPLTGAPLDKPWVVSLGRTGGTAPFHVVDLVGSLPTGLAVDPDTFEIVGTATVAGGQRLDVTGGDIAGSEAGLQTQIVVCVPFDAKKTNLDMAAGDASAGFYMDVLGQTVVNLVVKTLKKHEKRDLDLIVIGPSGAQVTGGVLKLGKGKAILKKLVMPVTGRCFVALSSETGGETTLVGSQKAKVPTAFSGKTGEIGLGDAVEVTFPAHAGATFKLKGKASGDLAMRIDWVVAPDGTVIGGGTFTDTDAKGGLKVTDTLDQAGEWTFRMVPVAGARGTFKYKFKVKNPKGAEYAVD